MKEILLIEHAADAPHPDRVRLFLDRAGRPYRVVRPFAGDSLPTDMAQVQAAVIYGGAQEIYQTDLFPYLAQEHAFARDAVSAGVPLLGICLGSQCIAWAHGADVAPHPDRAQEFGYYPLRPTNAGASLFPEGLHVPHWHGHGFQIPPGAQLLAEGEVFPHQAFRLGSAWAFQFHPEVTPDLMRWWQNSAAAPWAAPGAQTRETQEALRVAHDPALDIWFNRFLAGFFG